MATRRWPSRKRPTKPEAGDGGAGDISFAPAAAPTRRRSPRKAALDLLARREHGVAELRAKLADREFPADEIEATLAALQAEGLLSEARFLEAFVASHARRGHGPVWIRAELERKGVAGEAIRQAIEAAEVDWEAEAEAVRVKRFGPEPPADFQAKARQARFLQYRGFRTRLLD